MAHDYITSVWAGLQQVGRHCREKNATKFGWEVVHRKSEWKVAKQALSVVGDEFSAVANEVVSEQGFFAPSWHQFLLDLGRWYWWIDDWVLKDKYPDLGYLERHNIRATLSEDDFCEWAARKNFAIQVYVVGDSYHSHLTQELCRAVDRRLITGRNYPGDENPYSREEDDERVQQIDNEPFVPHLLQKAILRALDGRALKKEALADACDVDPRRLYKPGALSELVDLGIVKNKRGIGYYRPDASPPDAIELNHDGAGTERAPGH